MSQSVIERGLGRHKGKEEKTMKEREVINKIKSLRKIEPNENWVSLIKSEIFNNSQEETFSSFTYRFLFSKSMTTAFVTLGFVAFIFVSAQGAYPGDPLYSVKRATEKGNAIFVSQENKSDFNFRMANKRLEEISEILKRNQVEKLSLAIEELESAKNKIQNDFTRSVESKPRERKVEIAKGFASTILEMEDREELILGSLAVKVDDKKESIDSNKELAFLLIEDFEERSLTEEDELLLEEAKKFFEQGKYLLALRVIEQASQSEKDKEVENEKQNNNEEEKEN